MEVEAKTPEEVIEYAKAFWERYEEIANFESVISMFSSTFLFVGTLYIRHHAAQIEKGEQKIKRRQEIQLALDVKVIVTSSFQPPFS